MSFVAEKKYQFRTALQGFNRVDVANFIEENTQSHEAQVRQLQNEISRLTADLSRADDEILQLKQAISDSPAKVQDAPSAAESPAEHPAAPADVPAEPQTNQGDWQAQELAAYRRAELAERQAKQRAAQVLSKVEKIAADTNTALDSNCVHLAQLSGDLSAIITQLQEAMQEIQDTFHASIQSMQSLEHVQSEPEQ